MGKSIGRFGGGWALNPCWILLFGLLAMPLYRVATAQIYECPGADGSRVFSDKKCGPDAKTVKGIVTGKRAAPKKTAAKAGSNTTGTNKAGTKTPLSTPRPAAELQQLLKLCDAGDDAACTKWTKGGGPNLLREHERQAEMACEAGSLVDCESRYCRDGASEDCRQRVLRTAALSGDTWYLRADGRQFVAGSTTYDVRCVNKNEPQTRDITIACAAANGPHRCTAINRPAPAFTRLDQAATNLCSTP
jgi:hypothetical protein